MILKEEIKKDDIQRNEKNENKTFKPVENYDFKPKHDVLVLFSFLLFATILITLIAFLVFTIFSTSDSKIARGISIKNIDVSGLSKEEAKQKISEYISLSIPSEITLKHEDFESTISTSDLSIFFNIDEAVDLAYNYGKTGNILKKEFDTFKAIISKINVEPGFSLDENELSKKLEDISTKLPDKIIESNYYIENNNLIITKGSSGSVIDVSSTNSIIINAIKNLDNYSLENPISVITYLSSPKNIDLTSIYNDVKKEPSNAYYTQDPFQVFPSETGLDFAISFEEAQNILTQDLNEYTIPLKVLYPEITTNMIGTEAFPDLLSDFSTKYSVSNKNRTTNLMLASNKINGTVVMPGETFSYNKIVGKRTIAAGYKEAPIYNNGKVENGLGGGICQITTTLYNAALFANLDIIERSNHQFIPSYANASRDATVVYGAIDFKFKNNRNYPIKITCSVSNGIANFKIWGLKTDDDYQVEISSRITKTTSNSIYSEGYKTLKKNGTIISSEVISRDVYKKH